MSTEKSPVYRVVFEISEYRPHPMFSLQKLTTVTSKKKFLRKTKTSQEWKSIQYFYVDSDGYNQYEEAAFEVAKNKAVLALKAFNQYDGLVIYP